ncbi:MAG: hypothetical protein IJR08_03420 [Bacilli bacterium]|nr:hypothetical protein [Bacilli bacterium]
MKEKKPFTANKNHFYVFIGLFLCLFSVILVLNTGVVARVLSTPFTFLFGSLSYFLYIAINVLGLRLIFAKKGIKIRFNSYFLASLILFISITMFFAHFVAANSLGDKYIAFATNDENKTINFFEAFMKVFNDIQGGYLQTPSLMLFSHPFASGIIGYFLVGAFNALFGIPNGGLIFAIVIGVIALFIYFLPLILKLMGQSKEKKVPSKVEEERETVSDIAPQKQNQQRVKNIDVVKHASEIDVDNYESEIIGSPTNRSSAISSPTFIQQDSGANNFSISDNGMFVPAKFVTDNGQHNQEIPAQPQQNEQLFDQVIPEETMDADYNEVRREQLKLDFDAAPEINQELVQAKPVFEEPKMVSNPAPQVAPIPTPEPEKPKPRERVKWIQPSTEVLNVYETSEQQEINRRVAVERQELINTAFQDFGVGAHVEDFTIGPSVTRFNVKYDHNVSVRSVSNMVQDIQIRLSGVSARFENIVEGQSTSGLEIPNASVTTVAFKDVFEALPDVKKHPLAVGFGKNIKGDVIYADFDEFPHMLCAGTTGSGKSIFTNSIIVTLIMRNSPDDLKMVLIDPKKVEMSRYKDMPHLLCPIITEAKEAKALMEKLCQEMEDRYQLFAQNGCSNIREFNEDAPGLGLEKLPYIMIFFDEYADIVDQCKEISMPVVSIAQKARACGIHLSIATQRPSTNVVTGVIKANLPTHVALMMASSVDSMTIIGEGGAEKLIGKGDMLVQSPLVSRVGVVRLQGCFIHRQEITRVVGYLKEHYETHYDEKYLNLAQETEQATNEYANSPEFKEAQGNTEEERYQAIKEWVLTQEYMSISRIQRECAVGFNRAGRFFLRLQSEGVVASETEGNKGCPVLADRLGGDSVVTSDEQTSFRSDD